MIALDRSLGLLGIAKEQEGGVDVVRGDLGCRGWRDGVFVCFSPLYRPCARPSFYRVSRRCPLGYLSWRHYPVPSILELVTRLLVLESRARCWSDSLTYECRKLANIQDFTISVAAIHHLSTPIRRRQAVQVSLFSPASHLPVPH